MPLILPAKTSEKFWLFLYEWFREKSRPEQILTGDITKDTLYAQYKDANLKQRICERLSSFCSNRIPGYWEELEKRFYSYGEKEG